MQNIHSSKIKERDVNMQKGKNTTTERRTGRRLLAALLSFVMVITMTTGMLPASQVRAADNAESRAAGDKGTTADPGTLNAWEDILQQEGQASTKNIGRIWTDKTVADSDVALSGGYDGTVEKGEADFLVGLSALSSTSNLKTTVMTSKPLDIVLVLDTSGSMDNGNGDSMGYVYTEVYGPEPGRWADTYYIQLNGRWTEVESREDRSGYYWAYRDGRDWVEVTPTTSAGDTDEDHIQFYSRENVNKMEALQNAVNTFIDSTAEMNDSITDPDKQHRISLVKFASDESNAVGNDFTRNGYNKSQVVSDLAAYNSQNSQTIKNTVNSLYGEGATQADYGLHQAQRVLDGEGDLKGARTDAQKVVIFFTDGNPTSGSSFEGSVAARAINYAYHLKESNALIYSIGVFQDADPSDTRGNFNKYMNAVSSNYPDARCMDTPWWGGEAQESDSFNDLDLGDRVTSDTPGEEAPQYYFAATDSEELDNVFEEISDSIQSTAGSGSPIEENTASGGQDTPGYLTFTDKLGSYMEITGDTMTLVYGDQTYTASRGRDGEWSFPDQTVEGNDVYASANLSDIKITVTEGSSLAEGSTVTVQIPASLIPLRNYRIDGDEGTMSVSSAYPVRLFYGVSVKEDALTALSDPTGSEYAAIVGSNASADKTHVEFYSNDWTKDQAYGNTTASFTPNAGNKFYYYVEDTKLYIDEGRTTPATRWNINSTDTLYFAETYYVQNGNSAQEMTDSVAVSRNGQDAAAISYDRDGNAYIPAGSPRYDRPAQLQAVKTDNPTGTASNVLDPSWAGQDATTVSQRLGNNGKLSVELPAVLAISKIVSAGAGLDKDYYEALEYEMDIHVDGADGDYKIEVKNAQGDVVSDEDAVIHFDADGDASYKIKGSQTLYIYGLNDKASYTVEETAPGDGFSTEYTNEKGTLAGGSTVTAVVTNTYRADTPASLDGEIYLTGAKVLTPRDWQDGDSFTFRLRGVNGAPMPEGTAEGSDVVYVTLTNEQAEGAAAGKEVPFHFGDIQFTQPGEYRYVISEVSSDQLPGMTYSLARYRVTVNVADNHDGSLKIESVDMVQTYDDLGTANDPAEKAETAVFTNTFNADSIEWAPEGHKNYSSNSGGYALEKDMFHFQITATGDNADEAPQFAETVVGNALNGDIAFQPAQITADMVGNTYTYEVKEVIQKDGEWVPVAEAVAPDGTGAYVQDGMTYDGSTQTFSITVGVNEAGALTVTPVYGDGTQTQAGFTNSYDPQDLTLTGDTAIRGTKTLTGREWKTDEYFGFTLRLTSDNAEGISGGLDGGVSTADVTGGVKDDPTDFIFADITFTKEGIYTFEVTESGHRIGELAAGTGLPADSTPGMKYDRHVCTVTVEVTDQDGVLTGTPVYDNGEGAPTEEAVFVNSYTSTMDLGTAGGIKVSKTLTGRSMAAGEFDFTIKGAETDTVSAEDADTKLSGTDREFANTEARSDGAAQIMEKMDSLAFDQDDAGRTFAYIIDEAEPEAGEGLAAVIYDQSQYRVEITPVDNGDGTMYAEVTVTRIRDAQGTEVSEELFNSTTNADGYTAPVIGFNNQYDPDPAVVGGEGADTALKVTKKVEGAGYNGDFTFTAVLTSNNADAVEGLDGDQAVTATAEGPYTDGGTSEALFGQLTFKEAGTYTFKVTENAPASDDGWTWSSEVYSITVTVRDRDNEGNYLDKLTAEIGGNNPTFTNRYKADPVIVGGDGTDEVMAVNKTVTGNDTAADFSFTLTPADPDDPKWENVSYDSTALKASVTEDFTDVPEEGMTKSAQFGTFTFSAEGTYVFNVVEDQAQDDASVPKGWTYDDSVKTITVVVTDSEKDGQLDVDVSTAPTFTNSYKADHVTVNGETYADFGGTKTLYGRDSLDGESFGFTLTPADPDDPKWENVEYGQDAAEASVTDLTRGTAKGFAFGDVTFKEAGSYTFNVSETEYNDGEIPAQGTNGMTFDTHTGTITVNVTDDLNGSLTAEVVKGTDQTAGGGANEAPDFVNSYAAEPATWSASADAFFGGHKYINDETGGFQLADDMFTFVMRAQDNAYPMPDGMNVTQDGEGRNIVTVTNQDTDAGTNSGVYDFGSITFEQSDMAGAEDNGDGTFTKTFQYNIFEADISVPGITKDNTAYTVTFTVTEDQNKGTMSVEASAVKIASGGGENTPADMGKLDFTNTHNAGVVSGYQNIFKTLKNRSFQKGDTFTFDIAMTAVDENGDPMTADELPVVTNDVQAGQTPSAELSEVTVNDAGDGFSYTAAITPESTQTGNTYRFDTGKITYSHPGVYTYTVSEQDSTVAGVTSDDTVYTVVVTVTLDQQTGALKREAVVTPELAASGTMDFTNTYTAQGILDGEAVLDVQKTFTGREDGEWTANDVFTFVLSGRDGAPMPEGSADGVKTIQITADNRNDDGIGLSSFGDIKYSNADAGKTYIYTISEQAGNVYGTTYSEAEYQVTVTVTDKLDGTLDIQSEMVQTKSDDGTVIAEEDQTAADAAAFANTYDVPDDTKTVEKTDADGVKTDVNGQMVGVGDTLTYTVHWVNDAVDEDGAAVPAEVTVTDVLPAGTALIDGTVTSGGTYDGDTNTITWTLGEQPAAAEGDVSFQVTVTDAAVTVDKVTNTAEITVGDNAPKTTNEASVTVPEKSVENNNTRPDGSIQVGDRLTYTIEYGNTGKEAATVVVTDKVPAGLTVDTEAIGNNGVYDPDTNTITWTIENVQPGTMDTVSFVGIVNESAVQEGDVENTASIQIGEDSPAIDTNTTPGEVKSGSLMISKMIVLADAEGQGTEIDAAKEFTFTVELKDASGNPLTGTYEFTGTKDGSEAYTGTISNGGTLTLKHGGAVTIAKLPEGARYTVTEKAEDGYTPDQASKSGSVTAGETAEEAFVNTYSASAAAGVPAGFDLKKVFEGREWTEDYAFQFRLAPVTEGAPMPKNAEGDTVDTVTVNAPTEADGKTAVFNFGEIEYTKAGTYEYTVTEIPGDNAGIEYSNNVAKITVTVTDKDQTGAATGKLTATAVIAGSTFTNTYDTGEVDYDAAAGMQIVKNMTGTAIKAGDFTFTMEGKDKQSVDKLNGGEPKEFTTAGAALTGNTASETLNALTGLKFAKADAGNTYTYTVKENIPENASDNGDGTWTLDGRTYDGTVYEVAFKVTEDGEGTLSVETLVDGVSQGVTAASRANARTLPVQLVFNNSYNAEPVTAGGEGDVEITASKELTNHPMTGGEFSFNVVNTRDAEGTVILTGTNDADGNVVFNGNIEYTTEKLNNDTAAGLALRTETEQGTVYEYQYTISEETAGFDGTGFAGVTTSADIVIRVTDNGTGKLSAEAVYPENGVVFQNTYGAGASAETTLKGDKTVRAESGDNPPTSEDIAGRYTFTVTGTDEDGNALPAELMPERTSVTNDASGNVDFGKITFTMENVFGVTGDDLTGGDDAESGIGTLAYGQRSKTYTYTIAETDTDPDAPVPGVTNDTTVKTVTVTVTDNGDGTLSISKTQDAGAAGSDFTFTNIYNIRPTDPTDPSDPAASGISFRKIWDVQSGTRELAAGDFQFVLSDMEGTPVMTGTNDADGNIAMVNVDGVTDGIVFNTPGDYSYVLTEVIPEEAAAVEGGMYKLDGVTYVPASYNVTAHVTDNGDGTMSVAWSMTDAEGKEVKEAQFVNMYSVDPTSVVLGAGKMLSGRDLKSGEFTFELKDKDGKTVSAAKNDGNGAVVFEELTFGNVGEYQFTISEVKGNDKTITYDETVFDVNITVTDNGDGTLTAAVDDGGKDMVFKNTYTKPAEPQKPQEPGAVQTGDDLSMFPAGAAAAAALAVMAAVVGFRRNKRQ